MLPSPPPGERSPGWTAALLLLLLASLVPGCPRAPQPCQDPTNEGICFCPLGISCHHICGDSVGHCTLGCSQANPNCSVSCGQDCTALCAGAGLCDVSCGDNCNVSCEGVKQRCAAVVGTTSRVNCEGAADCEVTCHGSCTVSCPLGHCRLRCLPAQDCDMDCGGDGTHEHPLVCPDGTRVCNRRC